MSPKSVQRFWDNDMREAKMHVAQKCAAVLDNDMHEMRKQVCAVFPAAEAKEQTKRCSA
jgi:hypothetical protein